MDTQKYYISIETGQILEDKEAASYEYEVEATSEEINELRELFDKKDDINTDTFLDGHVPNLFDEVGSDVELYNKYLVDVYKKIYQLGTVETKEHIEKSNIIKKLSSHTDTYEFG